MGEIRVLKGRGIWLGGGLFTVMALTVTALVVWGLSTVRLSGSSPAPLKTLSLQKGDLILSVPATGVVEPVFSVEIKSRASGEVRQVRGEEGDRVEKGDLLVEIDPRLEEIGVRRAQADLLTAEAEVKKAEIFVERARASRVRKDQLHEKGFLADQEKEEAYQEEGLRKAELTQARAHLLRARETLSEAEERLRQTRVISPVSGIVLSSFVERGQIISSGTSSFSQGTLLAVVGDLSRLQIRAEVDETDARMVAPGQEARVSLDAFPGQTFPARVVRVAPGARMKNDLAVVSLLLALDEIPEGIHLRPGLSANLEIITRRLSGVLLLPREALHQEEGKWGLSVVRGGEVTFHEVGVGASDGKQVEILTDLPEGTRVRVGSAGRPGGEKP